MDRHRLETLDPLTNSAMPDAADAVASFTHDPDRRRHAGLEQQIRVGRTDDNIIGCSVLIYLRRLPDLRYLPGERTVREGIDRERSFVSLLDLADVLLTDFGLDDGQIRRNEEER